MKKFWALFKKELGELITVQTLLPLVIIVILFSVIGNVVNKELKKAQAAKPVIIVNEDNSSLSKGVIEFVGKSGFKTEVINDSVDAAIKKAKDERVQVVGVIPVGFETNIKSGKPQEISVYTIMNSFSTAAARDSSNFSNLISLINDYTSRQLISEKISGISTEAVKNPIKSKDIAVVQDREANVSPTAIMGFVATQTTFIPIILFMVIIISSMMIATAMATEKENKTLETLLTAPIDRKSIVLAKMGAAGVYSLGFAAVYMVGFRNFMSGMGGELGSTDAVKSAVAQLGLTLGWPQYFLLGLTLFISILIALTIAIIIGSFAEDVKSVNGLITPLMILVMIPYLLALVLDINTLGPSVKWFVYAIPFSHPFLAAPNLFLHNYSLIFFGILYQLVVFTVLIFLAAKLFTTDKISTLKLNFNRKKK